MSVVERKPLACSRHWPQGGLFGDTGTGLGWKSSGVQAPSGWCTAPGRTASIAVSG